MKRLVKWLFGVVVLALASLTVGAAWLLGTQSGLRWSAETAAVASGGRLELSGVRGTLAGDIRFDEIRFLDGGTDIRLGSGELRLDLLAALGGRAGVRSMRAEDLRIDLAGDGGTARPPSLPMSVGVESAEIALIRFRGVTLENFQLSDAAIREQGEISASASFAVREAPYPARVRLQLAGSLQRIEAAVSASVADIPVLASAVLTPFAERPLQALDARTGPADLSRLEPQWPRTALTLELNGKADAARALAGTLAVRNAQPGTVDAGRVPLASLDARFATDLSSLELQDLRIAGAGTLRGSAHLEPGQARLELRVSDLNLRQVHSSLTKTRLSGPLTIVASPESQSVQGTLSQDSMSLGGEAVRRGDVVEIRRLRAEAEGGEATGSGRLLLGGPPRFETRLALARFDPARFGDYPAGSINGSVEASGVLQEDFAVDARWTVTDSTLLGEALASSGTARIMRQRVSRADAEMRLGHLRLAARGDFGMPGDELALQLDAPDLAQLLDGLSGSASASGRFTGTWESPRGSVKAQASGVKLPNGLTFASVAASVSGALAKHDAEIQAKAEGVDLTARLRGGWQGMSGWSGELYTLRNAGAYPLELTQPASLSISPGGAKLGRLQAKLGAGRLLVKQLTWSESRIASSGEVAGLPAQWLVLAAGLADRLKASLLLDGRWDLAAAPALSGTLALRRAAGDLILLPDDFPLGLEKAELEARFEDDAVTASATLASRYGTADARGTLQGLGADAPLDFTARLRSADLQTLLQPFLQDVRVDGSMTAELRGSGTLAGVKMSGSVHGDALELQVPPYGVFLGGGELRATLEGDRLRISRFSIAGSGGRLTANGTLPLRLADGAHLDWRAEEFGLLARPDLRLTVSGAGEATLAGRKFSLSGALRADRGYLELQQETLPQLGDDVVIVGQARAPARQSARVPVALDVQLDLGEQLEVSGYGLEGKLTGKLQVRTTEQGELRVHGRVQTVNATFLAYGQRLQVDPGIAIFDGPPDNPALQMTAWRRNQQVEAGVQISGTARAPRVQLVSQPPVPEGERLSWLVLGRAPGEATKADLGLLQAAAGALLARGDQVPLDRRIAQAFGLDEISLRGSGEVGDRVVAVGKRLSDRLYVSYEQGLGVVASSLVKLDLALTQRLSVRTETGTSSGVGLFYRFSWD